MVESAAIDIVLSSLSSGKPSGVLFPHPVATTTSSRHGVSPFATSYCVRGAVVAFLLNDPNECKLG